MMITAIVLSAGESRRMGTQKALLPYGRVTVIEHIVDVLNRGGVDEVIAVTGHEPAGIVSVLAGTAARTVGNGDYLTGMLSSVRCGVQAAAPQTRAFLIALGDQPSIRVPVVQALLSAWRAVDTLPKPQPVILVPAHSGKRGHPMLFSSHFRDAVLTQFDNIGLRGMLLEHPERIVELSVPQPGILRDIDNPDDYLRELQELNETDQEFFADNPNDSRNSSGT